MLLLMVVCATDERRSSRQESDNMLERVLLDPDKLFHRHVARTIALLFRAPNMARINVWLRTVRIFFPFQISPGTILYC